MTVLNVRFQRVTVIDNYDGLSNRSPAPAIQTRPVYPQGTFIPAWRCQSNGMSVVDLAALLSIVGETVGGAGIFQWLPPGAPTEIDVRFETGSLEWQNLTRWRSIVEVVIVSLRPA